MKHFWKDKSIMPILGIVFLLFITAGTFLNAFEVVLNVEPEGRKKGLGHLELVEDYSINAWGGIQKLLGKKIAYGATFYSDVTLLNNGYATMTDQDYNIEPAKKGIIDAKKLAEEIGADYLYVAVSGKVLDASMLPKGVFDAAPLKREEITSWCREENIPVISMKEAFLENGNDWFDYFYISDHHCRNNAALLTCQKITSYMEEIGYEMNLDLLEEGAYEKTLYEDIFIGSHARMAGTVYAGLDDYELYMPKYETNYRIVIPTEGIDLTGDFLNTIFHEENLSAPSFDYYAYYAYLKEDYAYIELTNLNRKNGPKVLMVRDSSAVPVSAFFISQCSELTLLDLRYAGSDETRNYVKEKNPDIIIYLLGSGYLGQEQATNLK